MCASKPFSVTSSSISSSSCDLRLQLRLRGCRSVLRVTFVGHFVQSAAPLPPLPPPLCQVVKNVSVPVSCLLFFLAAFRAWILHMFICLYDGGTSTNTSTSWGWGQQGSLVQRLPLKLSDCKSVTHSPSFLNTRKQIFIYLRLWLRLRLLLRLWAWAWEWYRVCCLFCCATFTEIAELHCPLCCMPRSFPHAFVEEGEVVKGQVSFKMLANGLHWKKCLTNLNYFKIFEFFSNSLNSFDWIIARIMKNLLVNSINISSILYFIFFLYSCLYERLYLRHYKSYGYQICYQYIKLFFLANKVNFKIQTRPLLNIIHIIRTNEINTVAFLWLLLSFWTVFIIECGWRKGNWK